MAELVLKNQRIEKHRDSRLRKFQHFAERTIGWTITPGFKTLYKMGWMKHTVLAEKIDTDQDINADDLTVSGLQLMVRAAHGILENTREGIAFVDYRLGWMMDAFDGMLARHSGPPSPEGGMKDVSCDRLAEFAIADMLTSKMDLDETLNKELKIAFVLSTLTKATSEMYGKKSSEGGQAGMIVRRSKLNSAIKHVSNGDQERAKTILEKVKTDSENVAIERSRRLSNSYTNKLFHSDDMHDIESPAAREAKKYAAIVMICESQGIDIVTHLNNLIRREDKIYPNLHIYPPLDELRQYFYYIEEACENIHPFLESANELARIEATTNNYRQ